MSAKSEDTGDLAHVSLELGMADCAAAVWLSNVTFDCGGTANTAAMVLTMDECISRKA